MDDSRCVEAPGCINPTALHITAETPVGLDSPLEYNIQQMGWNDIWSEYSFDGPVLPVGATSRHHGEDGDGHGWGLNTVGDESPVDPSSAAQISHFCTTLDAPISATRNAHQPPVVYLDKDQDYPLFITYRNGPLPVAPDQQFRTDIHISFDDEQRDSEFELKWKSTKEKKAMECFVTDQRAEIKSSSFNSSSVIWTPHGNDRGLHHCEIRLRFRFLSSESAPCKRVPGIPMSLCVKSQILLQGTNGGQPAEDSFCMLMVFRPAGAKRKLINEIKRDQKLTPGARGRPKNRMGGEKYLHTGIDRSFNLFVPEAGAASPGWGGPNGPDTSPPDEISINENLQVEDFTWPWDGSLQEPTVGSELLESTDSPPIKPSS